MKAYNSKVAQFIGLKNPILFEFTVGTKQNN